MKHTLDDKQIAILVADGVESSALQSMLSAIRDAGGQPVIVAASAGEVRSWAGDGWGEPVTVDVALSDTDPDRFDGVAIPSGFVSSDSLRASNASVGFVREMVERGRPVAALGHAVWLLIETELAPGMELAGWPSIATDVRNAGARWEADDIAVYEGILTGRGDGDLTPFLERMVEEFAEGRHERAGITDVVSEASEESFPASDPPSWQPGAATSSREVETD